MYAHENIAIVRQNGICNRRELFQRFIVRNHDGLFADVSTGHDQTIEWPRKEQMVKRRVGQNDSQLPQAGGHALWQSSRLTEANQNDWRRHAAQQGTLPWAERAEPLRSLEISHHYGKRLSAASLAQPERVDGTGVLGVARELKSTDTFDGNDAAVCQCLNRRR